MQNSFSCFCQTFIIRDMGQPLDPARQATFTCHLPREKFCKKYLPDPAFGALENHASLVSGKVEEPPFWIVATQSNQA